MVQTNPEVDLLIWFPSHLRFCLPKYFEQSYNFKLCRVETWLFSICCILFLLFVQERRPNCTLQPQKNFDTRNGMSFLEKLDQEWRSNTDSKSTWIAGYSWTDVWHCHFFAPQNGCLTSHLKINQHLMIGNLRPLVKGSMGIFFYTLAPSQFHTE
jgi:hypothetical protein